jgi:N-acetylglucosaminylphosphatidylinositol deacetylase
LIIMADVDACDRMRRDGCGDGLLVVTAHPDDEAMFFAPALLCLGGGGSGLRIHLLCLSTGNYDGLGAQRKKELPRACKWLGVPSERVAVCDEADIADSPHVRWPAARVAAIVQSELQRLGIRRVLTFDARGVTGHANHVDTHHGVRHLMLTDAPEVAAHLSDDGARRRRATPAKGDISGADPGPLGSQQICAYELRSVGFARRLLGLLEAIATLLCHAVLRRWQRPTPPIQCFVRRPWAAALTVHCAMREHASQYVWFRRLYVLVSRYVFLNTLARMVV